MNHWKRPWCWEGLGAGGEGDNRGWDGWMASLTQWTWVWVDSRSWWWTGRSGVLQFMGSQRVGHDWATELNWTEVPVDLQWTEFSPWPLRAFYSFRKGKGLLFPSSWDFLTYKLTSEPFNLDFFIPGLSLPLSSPPLQYLLLPKTLSSSPPFSFL